jgi:hypothetical protein
VSACLQLLSSRVAPVHGSSGFLRLLQLNPSHHKLIKAVSRTALIQQIAEFKGDLPVFFLDELPAHDLEGIKRAMLLRNVFRSVGLVAVLSGTNTAATDLKHQDEHSRGGGDSDRAWRWSIVLREYPSTSQQSLSELKFETNLAQLTPSLQAYLREELVRC